MTTHVLQITDGSTTIDLYGTTVHLRGAYVPTPSILGERVTESFEIVINESSTTAALGKIESINQMLEQARAWSEYGQYAPVYVILDPADAGIDRAAIIHGGVCRSTDLTLAVRSGEGKTFATIEWVRDCYAAKTGVALDVYGYGGTHSTGGVVLTNSMDCSTGSPTYGNYMYVKSADIDGDFPGQAKMVIKNTNATGTITEAFVSSYSPGITTDFWYHWFEGESGTAGSGVSATTVSSSACSMSAYAQIDWTSASETELVSWTTNSTVGGVLRAMGKFCLLARLHSGVAYTDLYFRFKLGYMNGATFVPTVTGNLSKVPASTELFIVDSIDLAGAYGRVSKSFMGELVIVLYATKQDGTATSIKLDYVCAMPINYHGGIVHMNAQTTVGPAHDEDIVIDTPADEFYRIYTGGTATTYIPEYTVKSGIGLYLIPNQQNSIFVLVQNNGASDPFHETTCTLVYYPRYRTV